MLRSISLKESKDLEMEAVLRIPEGHNSSELFSAIVIFDFHYPAYPKVTICLAGKWENKKL